MLEDKSDGVRFTLKGFKVSFVKSGAVTGGVRMAKLLSLNLISLGSVDFLSDSAQI